MRQSIMRQYGGYDKQMDHLPAHLLPVDLDVKCTGCGRVHRSISLAAAKRDVAPEALARMFSCAQCGAPSRGFVLAQPADLTAGSTLQPIVIRT